jgi:hypothetical protein
MSDMIKAEGLILLIHLPANRKEGLCTLETFRVIVAAAAERKEVQTLQV